jgi:hypothetical protein
MQISLPPTSLTSLGFEKEEEAHLEKMLENGMIQPSNSEWASVPVLVRKKDGGMRWCIDYHKLNSINIKDVYPLLLIEECMDALSGNVWFLKLDANMAKGPVILSANTNVNTITATFRASFRTNCRSY